MTTVVANPEPCLQRMPGVVHLLVAVFMAMFMVTACSKEEGSEESAVALRPDIEVDAEIIEDANGSIRATVKAGHANTQIVKASPASAIAAARLAFAPGTFDVDNEILLEEGQSLVSKIALAQILGDAVTLRAAAPAVLFTWSFDEDSFQPVTVMVPEPAVDAEGDSGALVVVYLKNVPAADNFKLGVIPGADLKTGGGLVRFSTSGYGIFQALLVSQAPPAATEVDTTVLPGKVRDVTTPPESFALREPAGAYQPASFRVFWDAAALSRTYDVLLDSVGPGCAAPYRTYLGLTGTSRMIEALEGETYLCVVARNAAGATGASNNGLKIRVDASPPAVPGKPTSDGAVSTQISVTFRWNSVADVGPAGLNHYEVEVINGRGELLRSGPAGQDTEVSIIGFDGDSYVARVAAVDTAGNQSAWSAYSDPVLIDSTP